MLPIAGENEMEEIETSSGQDLRDMFAAATGWLQNCAADIDALNVLPGPDDDCGTSNLSKNNRLAS